MLQFQITLGFSEMFFAIVVNYLEKKSNHVELPQFICNDYFEML